MEVHSITLKIYAQDETEAERARQALQQFVNDMGQLGIRVTGNKIADVVPKWKQNYFVSSKIIEHFK